MPLLLLVLIAVAVLVVLDASTEVWGVDSRYDSDDPRTPAHGPLGA